MSMWVALNNIQAVDKGEDEKVRALKTSPPSSSSSSSSSDH
jgi:hypothetical protein